MLVGTHCLDQSLLAARKLQLALRLSQNEHKQHIRFAAFQ